MDNNLREAAENFMSTPEGSKLKGRKKELKNLTESRDGRLVRDTLEKAGFENAVRSGDTGAVSDAISKVMSTESGARLLEKLRTMMNG